LDARISHIHSSSSIFSDETRLGKIAVDPVGFNTKDLLSPNCMSETCMNRTKGSMRVPVVHSPLKSRGVVTSSKDFKND